jgi:hypothetical protein
LDLSLEPAVVFDPPLALSSDFFAEGFGGAFALQESGPSVVEAMKFGTFVFAGAIGFATGAQSGGDASWQQRDGDFEDNYFVFLCLYPNVLIH